MHEALARARGWHTSGERVARIDRDADPVLVVHALNDASELLEATAEGAPLQRHVLHH